MPQRQFSPQEMLSGIVLLLVIGRLLTNEIKPHSTINLNYGYKKTFYSCSSQVYQTEWLYSVNLTLNRSATIKDYWNMYVKEADSKETWYYLENIFWAYPPNTSTDFALKYKGTIPGGNCTWSFYSLGEPTEVPEPWTENSTTFNTSTSSTVSSTSTVARTTSPPNTTDTTDPANETCLCSCPCQPKSQESIDEMMEIILYDLIIAKNSTYQAKQRLISAHDERWISRGIGFVGVLVLSLVFGSIIVGDIKLILENARVAFRRILGR